jgi:Tol biopolymer transport system component
MIKHLLLVIAVGAWLVPIGLHSQVPEDSLLIARNLYLGQKPPGTTPKVFAPGIVSTKEYEVAGSFTPDGSEYFFTRRPEAKGVYNRIYYTRLEDSVWTKPELVPFGAPAMEFEPHVTPQGDKVYFNSERKKPAGITLQGEIWYAERSDSGWGEARYLDAPINDGFAMYVTSTHDGTLYFTGVYGRKYGIFRSHPVDAGYTVPEYLPDEINSIRPAHPYVSPDETYLIFDAYTAEGRKPEIYISFRRADGSWTEARKLGPEVNATQTEYAASVSPDGKYLFFHRLIEGNGDIYWVDASIIEQHRPGPE